jgi:alpha-tubulin suppressor-like RCC1 family protein
LTDITQISAGGANTCALKTNETIYCWGNNSGDNTTTNRHTPVQVKEIKRKDFLTNISQVAAGGYHTCALKTDGTVYCWGYNYIGQLGDSTNDDRYIPIQVKGVDGEGYLTDITQIRAGSYHACALKTNGAVYCWGANYNGQLGDNTDVNRYTPVQVKGVNGKDYLTNVIQVAAGHNHTCVLKTNGAVYCWGENDHGQLGDNTDTKKHIPVQVKGVEGKDYLTNVIQVAAGGHHTCALKTDGTIYCWGDNYYGQLGDNTNTNRYTPVQVKGVGGEGYLTDITQISAGGANTCALKTDRTVYCWGLNDFGQLGDNANTNRYTPVQVKGVDGEGYLTDITQISAGGYHTCALKTNGAVYCWGNNSFGQLSDNTDINRYTPVQVKGVGGEGYLTDITQISAGGYHACVLKTNGAVYCWGANYNGQLGDYTDTHRYTPVPVNVFFI